MINPTAKDIDRMVILVVPFTLEGKRYDRGRIAAYSDVWVAVTLDENDAGVFGREDLEWASGMDRA